MDTDLTTALRANADLALTRLSLREDVSSTELGAAAIKAEEAIATVVQVIAALELAESMLTVFGVEGEKLERIRAAIARVERFA